MIKNKKINLEELQRLQNDAAALIQKKYRGNKGRKKAEKNKHKKFKKLFDEIDTDGSGYIDFYELEAFLIKVN